MSAKHTPGPWVAGTKSVTAPETEDRLGIDVRLYSGNAGDNLANARLIAAAPDMLAALRELHAVCVGMDLENQNDRPTEEQYCATMDAARVAIKAATGATT